MTTNDIFLTTTPRGSGGEFFRAVGREIRESPREAMDELIRYFSNTVRGLYAVGEAIPAYGREDPLAFATTYLRTYRPETVHIPVPNLVLDLPFPTHDPYTEADRRRIEEMYNSDLAEAAREVWGHHRAAAMNVIEHERRHAVGHVTVRAEGEISAGDPVQVNGEGRVVAFDPGSDSDDMVIGTARRVDGDIVEVEFTTGYSDNLESRARRLERDVDALQGQIRRSRETESLIVKPKKPLKKYYNAETGLKYSPVLHKHGYMFLGKDHIPEERYNKCDKCFWYSLVFFNKEDKVGTKIIENDEDFEKIKTCFMTHFNKEHKDIVAKKIALKNPEKFT